MRRWFEGQGFIEVETPLRVRAPGQEVHLDAFEASGGRYLITSPEYHMKRLVAAGASRIYQITRAFRAGEAGPHHQPEFTMLEWYRAEAPLCTIADDCEALVRVAAAAVREDLAARFVQPFVRTTVAAVMQRHADFRLQGDESAAALAVLARQAGLDPGQSPAYDDVFFQVFLDRIEPALAQGPPTFVFDWPLPLAALARPNPDRPKWADRFELYAGGLELANAFGELTDPVEQRLRFLEESELRRARAKTVYPLDEALLAALSVMPPTSGVALGLDRLIMLVTGRTQISDVVAFPDDAI